MKYAAGESKNKLEFLKIFFNIKQIQTTKRSDDNKVNEYQRE
jgi:hypothetical protein